MASRGGPMFFSLLLTLFSSQWYPTHNIWGRFLLIAMPLEQPCESMCLVSRWFCARCAALDRGKMNGKEEYVRAHTKQCCQYECFFPLLAWSQSPEDLNPEDLLFLPFLSTSLTTLYIFISIFLIYFPSPSSPVLSRVIFLQLWQLRTLETLVHISHRPIDTFTATPPQSPRALSTLTFTDDLGSWHHCLEHPPQIIHYRINDSLLA